MSMKDTFNGYLSNIEAEIAFMKGTQSLFLELLKSGMWGQMPEPKYFVKADWSEIFRLADIQTVGALIFDGMALLPKEVHPPKELKLCRVAILQQVEYVNKKHIEVLRLIHTKLQQNRIHEVYMKGLLVAARYPNPLHRQPGDIDFVVAEVDFQHTLEVLASIGKVDFSMIHEHHGMAIVNGIVIEPHYKVHNFQCPSTDRAMKSMFDEIFPTQLVPVDIGGYEIPSFPPTFESVLLVSHMVNHIYEEGLGLRQIIDYAMFLNGCGNAIDIKIHSEYLCRMRMHRAWRIFACICELYLGVNCPTFVGSFTQKEKKMAKRLFEDVLRVGNFGRGRYVFKHSGLLDALKNYLWVVHRCLSLHFVCPSEATWWIFSKPVRFLKKVAAKSYI